MPRKGEERRIGMVVLRGNRVLLRPGRPEDADKLVRIRREPEVARRWGNADIEEEAREGLIGTEEVPPTRLRNSLCARGTLPLKDRR